MKSLVSLFLSQSYQDAWDDYIRSLNRADFARWDYVILTASNEQQAEGFRAQLRQREGFLPEQTRFAVLPDPEGEERSCRCIVALVLSLLESWIRGGLAQPPEELAAVLEETAERMAEGEAWRTLREQGSCGEIF